MILVDSNLILYAEDKLSVHHEKARNWWDAQLSGRDSVGLPWSVILSYIRISTNPRVIQKPLSIRAAAETVNRWLNQPCVHIIQPTENHWTILSDLLHSVGYAANLTMDAHLAALAIEYGCELCSADSDFSKFAKLRWKNPLRH